jgi:hypothetical protein
MAKVLGREGQCPTPSALRPARSRDPETPHKSCASASQRAYRRLGRSAVVLVQKVNQMHVRIPPLALAFLTTAITVSCSGSPAATQAPARTPAPTPVQATASASPSQSANAFYLLIFNIDGPDTIITINGKKAAMVTCSLKNAAASVGKASSTAPLPWQVEAVTTKGAALGKWTENGDNGPRQIVIRASGAMEEEAYGNAGTAPEPSCAP